MADTAYISQRQSVKRLHAETGKTFEECKAIVRSLPTEPVGKRDKIHRKHLADAIADHSRLPREVRPTTIRPLSARHKARFAATAKVEQVINGLNERARRASI